MNIPLHSPTAAQRQVMQRASEMFGNAKLADQWMREPNPTLENETPANCLENIERLKTLSKLRGRDIIAIEELRHMPLDIDMSDSIWAKEERAQGIQQGEREILIRQLHHRFGPLPNHLRSRVAQATKEQIEDWALRFYSAQSLADVFGE